MSLIKHFEHNAVGRDFAVGDIHGCFSKLQRALDAVQFNPERDRLFSVGDLVDRGPESADVDVWLRKPWFHAIRGNHEQMAIDSYRSEAKGDAGALHFANGGAWFYGLPTVEQGCYAELLADLPVAIEVETAAGLVGLVHADCPAPEWRLLHAALTVNEAPSGLRDQVVAMCQWSRSRIMSEESSGVAGIRAVGIPPHRAAGNRRGQGVARDRRAHGRDRHQRKRRGALPAAGRLHSLLRKGAGGRRLRPHGMPGLQRGFP